MHKTSLRCVIAQKLRTKTVQSLYAALAMGWLSFGVVAPVVTAQQAAEQTIAQKPLVATYLHGMAVTKDGAAVPLAVTMPRGINAPLEIINLKTMQRAYFAEQATSGKSTAGSAYVTLENRHVLIGTTTGTVYDVNPDKLTVSEQTAPAPSVLAYFDAVAAETGVVYFAARTITGDHVYAFDAAGSSWRDVAIVPDAAAGMALWGGSVYLGSSASRKSLTVVDTQTGHISELPLLGIPADTTSLTVQGAVDGLLYIDAQATKPATYVYDIAAKSVVDQQTVLGQLSASAPKSPAATQTPQTTPLSAVPTTHANTGLAQDTSQAKPQVPVTDSVASSTTQPTASQTNPNATASTQNHQSDKPVASGQSQTAQTTQTPTATTTQTNTGGSGVVPSVSQPVTLDAATVAAVAAAVSPPSTPEKLPIYYSGFGQYSPLTKTKRMVPTGQNLVPVKRNCWVDETRCLLYSTDGKLAYYAASSRVIKPIAPSPVIGGYQAVDSVVTDGSDTSYAVSLTPGAALLQIDRAKKTQRKMVAAPEGGFGSIVALGHGLVAGSQTGKLAYYDPRSPTETPSFQTVASAGAGAVTALADSGDGQVTFAVSELGASARGMVGVYDTTTRHIRVTAQPVLPDQSITSLVSRGSTVFVGGAVAAGNQMTASLAAYDTQTRRVTAKIEPVPGATTLHALALGSNGHIYGVADTTFFELDLARFVVLNRERVAGQADSGSIAVRGAAMFASVADKLYAVKTDTFQLVQIGSGSSLAVNTSRDLYYGRRGGMYRRMADDSGVTGVGTTARSGFSFDFSMIDYKVGLGTLAALSLLLVIPLLRLLHRPTYSTRR